MKHEWIDTTLVTLGKQVKFSLSWPTNNIPTTLWTSHLSKYHFEIKNVSITCDYTFHNII